MGIVDRIFELADKKFSQKEFALALGVKPQRISEWKRGISSSYQKYLPEIAELLGTTTDYLTKGEDPINRPNPTPISLDPEALGVAYAYQRADEKSRAMVRLALGISGQEYIYLPQHGDDKFFCTPRDKDSHIAAKGGKVIKKPSPTSTEKLDELSKATEKAAEKENDQY